MHRQEIKAALLNRDFELAQTLIKAWGESVLLQMRNANGTTEMRSIMDEAVAFAENNIHLARVVRAHIGTELQANSASFLYRDTDFERHRWHLKA